MKRFYKDVSVEPTDGGYRVLLDGRPIKTQMGRPQVVPTEALGSALAAEWAEQGEEIDPRKFLFRDHADFAIDIVGQHQDETIAKLLAEETDTLCYRAGPDEPLYRRQQEDWEPLLCRLEDKHGVSFQRISGVMHKPQPPETIATLKAHLEQLDDFALAGMTGLASLSASLAVALLSDDEAVNDPMLLWRDANLEEEWQADQWGREEEAEEHARKRARSSPPLTPSCCWRKADASADPVGDLHRDVVCRPVERRADAFAVGGDPRDPRFEAAGFDRTTLTRLHRVEDQHHAGRRRVVSELAQRSREAVFGQHAGIVAVDDDAARAGADGFGDQATQQARGLFDQVGFAGDRRAWSDRSGPARVTSSAAGASNSEQDQRGPGIGGPARAHGRERSASASADCPASRRQS